MSRVLPCLIPPAEVVAPDRLGEPLLDDYLDFLVVRCNSTSSSSSSLVDAARSRRSILGAIPKWWLIDRIARTRVCVPAPGAQFKTDALHATKTHMERASYAADRARRHPPASGLTAH